MTSKLPPLALAGDWHGNTKYAVHAITTLAQRAEGAVRTIIHVGDYGFVFRPEYVNGVQEALEASNTELLFIRGNHDSTEYLTFLTTDERGYKPISDNAFYLPSGVYDLDGTVLAAVGGAVSVNKDSLVPMLSWWPDETITRDEFNRVYDTLDAEDSPHVDLMVSHDAPISSTVPGIAHNPQGWPQSALIESERHRHVLEVLFATARPDYLVHGHYHTSYRATVADTEVRGLDCDGSWWDRNMLILARDDDGRIEGVVE